MKKAIGITACFLLGGCSGAPRVDVGPDISTKWPHQDTAPLPWVRMVPSERTIAFKDVNFTTIAEQIRYDMNFAPHQKKFGDIRMVLVDYTILPHENPSLPSGATETSPDQAPSEPIVSDKKHKNKKHKDKNPNTPSVPDTEHQEAKPIEVNNEDFSTRYESRPQRYVMILSFYACDKLPPDAPMYEETMFMRTDKAAPQEAMRLMAHAIIEDIHASPPNIRKFQVSLD